MIPLPIRTYTLVKNKGFSLDSCVCDSFFIQSANLCKCLILIQLTQDRLLLPVDKSDKVTCTKLQSFIEELKQPLYFTTPMAIVVITKLTFQNISMVMVDHLGNLAVTIASLSSSFYNIIGYRFIVNIFIFPFI